MAADCCCNLLGLFARVSGLAVFTAAKTRALFCVANCMHTTPYHPWDSAQTHETFDSSMGGQKGTGQISKDPFSEGKKIAPITRFESVLLK
jgi:hypothetical protein